MTIVSQRRFSGGEIAPSYYAGVDLAKYAIALRTMRNFMALRNGGTANRPGTTFVCEASNSSKVIRLLPFIFNASQTYVLEFGDMYIRFIKNGNQLRETAKVITNITQATTAVVTSNAHGYMNDQEVYISGVLGMTQVNNRNFKVKNVTLNTFELFLMDGVTPLNSTGYGAYTSGGTSEKVYEITSPYLAADLAELNIVQSADVITIVHPSYAPRELSRLADTNWTLASILFAPQTAQPTNILATAGPAGTIVQRYKITSVNRETAEESLPGIVATTRVITNITQALTAVVTSAGHGYANGDEVYIAGVVGMTEVNGRIFTVANALVNTFELESVDSTGYGAYVSGGTINLTYTQITAGTPTAANPHTLTWTKPSGINEFNIYKEVSGVYGLIGIAVGNTFKDIGTTPDTGKTPPSSRNPFIGMNNYPSAVTYIQQRLTFANTNNDPEKVYLSRSANFKNFTTSSPLQDDDAITFTMAGRQVNEVRNMIDIGRFVIFTSGGEWSVLGSNNGVLTPTNINPKQHSYNGSGILAPIIVGNTAIYQQARGSIVRDLGFDFDSDGYTGVDLTTFSSHLFDSFTLTDWAYQQIPHSIVWAARSDGTLLGMTYVREQQLLAWHRHDFDNGFVENTCVVPEGNEDVLYLTIKRTIGGVEKRYIEKFTTRQITDVTESKFMDSNLTFDGRNFNSMHTMTLSGGTTWVYTETLTLTSSQAFFSALDVGNQIFLNSNGVQIRATITAFTSSTVVSVKPNKTVPVSLRNTATTDWARAVDEVLGLWHIEGEQVSILGDGFVVASPNNEAYDVVTVTNGKVVLDKPYSFIHIGLPVTADLETLDIDSPQGQTLSDKRKLVQFVNMYVESSRGIFAGARPPQDDATDPLQNLTEFKSRNLEAYDDPISLKTEAIEVSFGGDWNNGGRVFVRQVDPLPLTVLSISPAGYLPFS